MSNPIHISQYSPDDLVRKVVLTRLNKQPWYVERKDFIALVAGAIITLAQLNLIPDTAPDWIHQLIGGITWAAALFVVSGTPGAVTKSMETRLANTAQELVVTTAQSGGQPAPANPAANDVLALERDQCAANAATVMGYGLEAHHGGAVEYADDPAPEDVVDPEGGQHRRVE